LRTDAEKAQLVRWPLEIEAIGRVRPFGGVFLLQVGESTHILKFPKMSPLTEDEVLVGPRWELVSSRSGGELTWGTWRPASEGTSVLRGR